MIVRSSLPQNVVVRHEISDSDIAKFFFLAQNVSSTGSSLKSVGRRFNPSYRSKRCLPSSATNKLRCEENRPKHFVSLHVLHSRACFGVPGRADAAAWTHYAAVAGGNAESAQRRRLQW